MHDDAGEAIELLIEPRLRPVGNGQVRRVLPHRRRRMVGPFIFADLMGPDHLPASVGVDVDAHPHIGLSTLTYLFDGALGHRDSTGAVQRIDPGAVNWMTAGAGVCHTERSPDPQRRAESALAGLQTWVALPTDVERGTPTFQHAGAATIPEVRLDGARLRIVAGHGWGEHSPVTGSSPLLQADLRLDGGIVRVTPEHRQRAVLCVEGSVRVAGRALPPGVLAVLTEGSSAEVSGSGRAVVLAGDPVGTRWIWWNFVASDPQIIEAAKLDWDAQRFPLVPGDHEPWVPRPSS